jgi:hypothetical protein
LLVPENTGYQPYHRIYHHHSWNFTTVADEIAHGNLPWVENLPDAFIEPFVPTAEEK